MFKKMGRPSRKGIASTIMLEEPNGEVLFFSIDNRGKSTFIGNKEKFNINANLLHESDETLTMTPSTSSDNLESLSVTKMDNSFDTFNQNKLKKEKTMFHIEADNLNMFLNDLNKNEDANDFLKTNRLSFHMLPPITA